MRELGRYLLWQLPGWGLLALVLAWLMLMLNLEGWVAAVVGFLFVAKDLLLFPAMRVAFRPSRARAWPIGELGHAVEPLKPSGYIRVNGELWKAEVLGPEAWVPAGSPVVVRDARGLTLLVAGTSDLPPGGE